MSVIFCISIGFPKFQQEYAIDWLDTLPRNHYFPAKPAPQVPKYHVCWLWDQIFDGVPVVTFHWKK